MNLEQIYAALFAKVNGLVGSGTFKTVSRRLLHWNDVVSADQPALFQNQRHIDIRTTTNIPPIYVLHADLYLYANTQDKAVLPASILNPMVDLIIAALSPSNANQKETLGGLVHYCRISGKIETDEGLLGDQAVVIIPIEILTT